MGELQTDSILSLYQTLAYWFLSPSLSASLSLPVLPVSHLLNKKVLLFRFGYLSMMKRPIPWDDQVDLVSSDDEAADMEADGGSSGQKQTVDVLYSQPAYEKPSEDTVVRRAKMYQEYMKKIPIPCQRGSVILCNSWMGLAKSIKDLYGQPLHYLTNILLKQWDQARFENGEELQPLDTVIHPLKAEATIWFVEEVHRRTASYNQLSKLWVANPMHHAFVDPIFPKI